jgi:hypothetical protein
MSTHPIPQQVAQTPAAGATNSPADSAEALQRQVDQAANFNLFSISEAIGSNAAIRGPKGVIGVNIREVLHRFGVTTHAPSPKTRLCASNCVGEAMGRFRSRWMIVPDDFVAAPDCVPPPTALDFERSQRFVMLDGLCTFGDGADGFRGFGTGQTIPSKVDGHPRFLAMGVGTILEGVGKFQGHENGTYVYCGILAPHLGFRGSLFLRVMDPERTFRTDSPLPLLQERPFPEPGITYTVMRGEAVPSDSVTPYIGPDGKPIGLIVQQGLKLLHVDSTAEGQRGIRAAARVGERIGRITAYVTFNSASARGTALDPIPFTAYDEFVFLDRAGRSIGGFAADTSDGRVFNITLSNQQGIRFGGVGRIRGGKGLYEEIDGLMTDNSVVIFSPHVSASVYVLRVHDPHGRFHAAVTGSNKT